MKFILSLFIGLQLIMAPLPAAASLAVVEQVQVGDDTPSSLFYGTPTPGDAQGKTYYNEKLSQITDGHRFYAYQTLSLSKAIVGMNLISQCRNILIPSVATFVAGSGVYIATEIKAGRDMNEHHNERVDELRELEKEAKNGSVQVEILVQRKKEEEKILEWLKKRKLWLRVVQLMYVTAGLLALAEEVGGMASGAGAAAGTCSSIAHSLAVPCGKAYPACYASHFSACVGFAPSGHVTAKNAFLSPGSVALGQAQCGAGGVYAGGCFSYLNTYLKIAHPFCSPVSIGSNFAGMATVLALPAAYAMGFRRGMPVTQNYVQMFVSLLMLTVPALQKLVYIAFNYPRQRIITYGAGAALLQVIIKGFDKREDVVKKNIEKLDQLVTYVKKGTADENGGTETDKKKEVEDKQGKKEDEKQDEKKTETNPEQKKFELAQNNAKPITLPKNCISNADGKFELSSKACSNRWKVTSPRSLKMEFNKLNNPHSREMVKGMKLQQVLGTLDSASQLTSKIANSLANGDEADAVSAGTELLQLESNMNTAMNQLKDKYNELRQLERPGEKLKSLEEEIADRVKEMENIYNEAAKAKGQAALAQNSSTSSSPSSSKEAAAQSSLSSGQASELKDASNADTSSTNAQNALESSPSPGLAGGHVPVHQVPEGGYSASTHGGEFTKLSEEEKTRVLEHYDRHKGEYSRIEEDDLFKILSKAYIRNLDKVLTRKKELNQ